MEGLTDLSSWLVSHCDAMKIITAIRKAFARMPLGLRLITAACLLMSCFLPVALIPMDGFFIGDKPVSFTEFWRRGGGLVFCSVGVVFALLAYGFISARRWARLSFVLAGLAIAIVSFISDHGISTEGIMTLGLFWLLPAWYLFSRPAARDYFRLGNANTRA